MKKILVPIDFSEHTGTVCRFAIEIAKKSGGEIRLFHAYFDYMIVHDSSFPNSVDTNEMFNQEMLINIRNEAKVDMDKLVNEMVDELKHKKVHNVKVLHTLAGGMPEDEILNISETYEPDLIVMGTRGKGEKEFLSGKVSSKVIKHVKCPVLCIPINAKYHGFDNMMYATDFNDEDIKDLNKLFGFLITYHPVVHCVHVNVDGNHFANESKMNALKDHFDEKISSGKLIFKVIDNEDFVDGINDYVDENKIDIISVVHHRKGFLKRLISKSHTHELLVHTDVPLYVFPGGEK